MGQEESLKKCITKKRFALSRNKFTAYKLCKKAEIRFGITYYFNERLQDTAYYLHDFSREYRESVIGEFHNRNLDLVLDICSWLNWREDNDYSSST